MSLGQLIDKDSLSTKALSVLQTKAPQGIINIIVNEGGNLYMAQENVERKIESSFNDSNLTGNIAIQSENVVQTQNIGTQDQAKMETAFRELEVLVQSIKSELTREQAEDNTEQLKAAVDSGDIPKSQKLLKFLLGSLGAVQPLIAIAQIAGIPIPNIPAP